jgi:hypothetical protein
MWRRLCFASMVFVHSGSGEETVAGNEWLVAGEDIAEKETKRQPSAANRNEVKMALRQTGRLGDQQTKRLRA